MSEPTDPPSLASLIEDAETYIARDDVSPYSQLLVRTLLYHLIAGVGRRENDQDVHTRIENLSDSQQHIDAGQNETDSATVSDTQTRNGVELIAAERQRQIDTEGWTPEHDDEHADAELTRAAICYAQSGCGFDFGSACDHDALWPWEPSWFKPLDMERDLVKAGALIAAEIDRLQRERKRS